MWRRRRRAPRLPRRRRPCSRRPGTRMACLARRRSSRCASRAGCRVSLHCRSACSRPRRTYIRQAARHAADGLRMAARLPIAPGSAAGATAPGAYPNASADAGPADGAGCVAPHGLWMPGSCTRCARRLDTARLGQIACRGRPGMLAPARPAGSAGLQALFFAAPCDYIGSPPPQFDDHDGTKSCAGLQRLRQ